MSSRHSVAFGIVLALVAMALSFLAVLALSSNAQIGSAAQAQYAQATTGETTAAQATAQMNSASSNSTTADAQAANADGNADFSRCDFFLHVVRDNQGGVKQQYRDDELIMHRFEQCLSADVLADTIPNRKLPNTGGTPLLGLALLGGAALVCGISVFRAGTRRRR